MKPNYQSVVFSTDKTGHVQKSTSNEQVKLSTLNIYTSCHQLAHFGVKIQNSCNYVIQATTGSGITFIKVTFACQSSTTGTSPSRQSDSLCELPRTVWAPCACATVSWSPPNRTWQKVVNLEFNFFGVRYLERFSGPFWGDILLQMLHDVSHFVCFVFVLQINTQGNLWNMNSVQLS